MSDSAAPVSPAAPAASSTQASDTSAQAGRAPNGQFAAKSSDATKAIQAMADAKAPGAAQPPVAAEGAETKAEKKARLLKLKVDGIEETVDLDGTSDDDLARELQLAKAARKRMSEAAESQKRIREAIEHGKQNPVDALRDLFGVEDPKAFMENYLTELYGTEAKKAQMSPEAIEAEKYKAELEQYKKREADAKKAREMKAREQFNQKVLESTKQLFSEALKDNALPKTQHTMKLLAHHAKINAEQGIQLTPQQLAGEVKRELAESQKSIVHALEGDGLLEWLGKDVVEKVIRARLNKNKTAVPATAPPVEPAQQRVEGTSNPRLPFSLRAWKGAK